MGRNYHQKCLARRGQVSCTQEQSSQTLLGLAQEMEAYSSFSKFVLAAKTSNDKRLATLLFGDTLFVYELNKFGNKIVVMKTENALLYEGAFVYTHELERLAADGKSYGLRSGIHPDIDSVRKEIFDRLLDAITKDGGHHHVLEIINAGLEKIESEEMMEKRKEQAQARATRIFGDIASDKLKSNPLLMFDGEGVLGFGFDLLPKVFIISQHSRRRFITLDAAPLGTGGDFSEGTSIQISHIFKVNQLYSETENEVRQMAYYLIRLFQKSGCIPRAKELALQLENLENKKEVTGSPKQKKAEQGQSVRAHVSPDVGMVIHYTTKQSSGGVQVLH